MIMKKLFFSLVALVIATVSYAQSTLVATLTHGDEIKMFYGVKALQQAHAAAVDGDVINLSGGNFEMDSNITKGITIRGTGVGASNRTNIKTDIIFNIPATATERLSIEGCYFSGNVQNNGTLTNAYFLKDRFKRTFNSSGHSSMNNAMFVNCYVDGFDSTNSSATSTFQFINSYIFDYYDSNESSRQAKFINCVVAPYYSVGNYIKGAQLMNCIIVYKGDRSNLSLSSSSSAWNCVACGSVYGKDIREYSTNPFDDLAFSQDCSLAGMDIFVDSNITHDLTDEAKATYLGNDGTPVGRYGGPFPFSWTPTYPQITKMNVANKTTADGKLSVEIEVSATE